MVPNNWRIKWKRKWKMKWKLGLDRGYIGDIVPSGLFEAGASSKADGSPSLSRAWGNATF